MIATSDNRNASPRDLCIMTCGKIITSITIDGQTAKHVADYYAMTSTESWPSTKLRQENENYLCDRFYGYVNCPIKGPSFTVESCPKGDPTITKPIGGTGNIKYHNNRHNNVIQWTLIACISAFKNFGHIISSLVVNMPEKLRRCQHYLGLFCSMIGRIYSKES